MNKLWRIFTTAICFSFFGLGGLLLSIVVLPLQRLFIKDIKKRQKLARKTVHISFKLFIGLMRISGTFSFDKKSVDAFRNTKGHLILANHPSLIDVVVLISMVPNANCIVKTHLFKNFFMKGVISNTGYISNDNPDELIKDCQQTLADGDNLIIFPQGTRTNFDDRVKFQRGAANIAVRCQAKITTAIIRVLPSTLTKNEAWYQIPDKKPTFSIQMVDNDLTLPENRPDQISKNVRSFNRDLEHYFTKELLKYE